MLKRLSTLIWRHGFKIGFTMIIFFAFHNSASAQSNGQQAHTIMLAAIRDKDVDQIRKVANSPWINMNELDLAPYYIPEAIGTGDIPTIQTVFEVGGRILQAGRWTQGKDTNNVFFRPRVATVLISLSCLSTSLSWKKVNRSQKINKLHSRNCFLVWWQIRLL